MTTGKRWWLLWCTTLSLAPAARAQLPRSRAPGSDAAPLPVATPRRADFPLAGLWRGPRTLPPGTDTVTLVFTVDGSRYDGATVYPDGAMIPHDKLTTTKAGAVWEYRNSGGGVWVYDVKLVGQDRLEGTVRLRDARASLQPPPTGKIALRRQLPAASR
jgi:hypothetical protein